MTTNSGCPLKAVTNKKYSGKSAVREMIVKTIIRIAFGILSLNFLQIVGEEDVFSYSLMVVLLIFRNTLGQS